ncbi:hypothetical protein ACFX2F_012344 [Malus domestica]
MSTFTVHSKADLQKCPTIPHFREYTPSRASRNTQFSSSPRIPLQTNDTKAKVSHITRVESKSISYHAFPLSFPLSLFLPAKTRIKKAICQNLHSNSGKESTTWNLCLVAYLVLLSSTRLQLLMYFQRRCHICLDNR